MGHTSSFAHAIGACEKYSIVTDATGETLHWRFCVAHMVLELCDEESCELCLHLRCTDGDSTA